MLSNRSSQNIEFLVKYWNEGKGGKEDGCERIVVINIIDC
jgi:hypothetical protein